MKTKAEIVQRLLNEKQIDAEEAVVLLIGEEKIQYVPYYPYYPQPYYPITPIWQINPPTWPYQTTSGITVSTN